MSRSGYIDDDWSPELALYRGRVSNVMRSKRGRAFLQEMAAAMDAMPEKRLIAGDFVVPDTGLPFALKRGGVCAMGAVAVARGIKEAADIDPYNIEGVAAMMDISDYVAREVAYENDEYWQPETPEQRWLRMRKWIDGWLAAEPSGRKKAQP